MKNSLEGYKVDVPLGRSGDWSVERFDVSKQEAEIHELTCMFGSGGMSAGRHVLPGTYTRLVCRSSIIMSDTPAEIRDHLRFIGTSHGRVLITGLGLGMVAQACLRRREVKTVTVIEKEQDVIDLVAPHYLARHDNLEIWHGDALTMKIKPNTKWDVAWHDIWPTICGNNLKTMKRLHRRFGGRVIAHQSSWKRSTCEKLNRPTRSRFGW